MIVIFGVGVFDFVFLKSSSLGTPLPSNTHSVGGGIATGGTLEGCGFALDACVFLEVEVSVRLVSTVFRIFAIAASSADFASAFFSLGAEKKPAKARSTSSREDESSGLGGGVLTGELVEELVGPAIVTEDKSKKVKAEV